MEKRRLILSTAGLIALLAGLSIPLRRSQDKSPPPAPSDSTQHPVADGDGTHAKSAERTARRNSSPKAEDVAAQLGSADNAQANLALENLLPDLMERDISGAARMAAKLDPWAKREQVLFIVAESWAAHDPLAALDWSNKLPDKLERTNCRNRVLCQLAQDDIARAIELGVANYEEGDDLLLASLAAGWLAQNPDAAEKWLSTRERDFRDQAWSLAVMDISNRAPKQAAELAVEKFEPGSAQNAAIMTALHQWIIADREAATAWVAEFPAGPLRNLAEGELEGRH